MDGGPFFAVDIGNTRIKCGRFGGRRSLSGVPSPEAVISLVPHEHSWSILQQITEGVLERPNAVVWWIASVNRPSTTEFLEALRIHRPHEKVFLLTSQEIPLDIKVDYPDRVGIDRLAAAVAAFRLRQRDTPVVVVDVGTAITVDFVTQKGEFLGGAIACGPAIAARALYEFTDLLPQIGVSWEVPPLPLGKNTPDAMAAGVFWGIVGTVRELIHQQARHLSAEPEVIVTGGGGSLLAELLGSSVRYVEHLTLMGIALSAQEYLRKEGQTV